MALEVAKEEEEDSLDCMEIVVLVDWRSSFALRHGFAGDNVPIDTGWYS
ncbi:MAG: hypothetical protein ACK5TW_00060 [Cyanobacteriota bacterium]|jgi:hypothetical protein